MKNETERSYFKVRGKLDCEDFEDSLSVDGGPVDAAFKCMKKIIEKKYSFADKIHLSDFHVSIAVRHGEESAVRTEIFFSDEFNYGFSTVGVDKNILGSAIEALEKGFRYFLKLNKKKSKMKC